MAAALFISADVLVSLNTLAFYRLEGALRPRLKLLPKLVVDRVFWLEDVCKMKTITLESLDADQFSFCFNQMSGLFDGLQMLTDEEKERSQAVVGNTELWHDIREKMLGDPRMRTDPVQPNH
jgi:hypothetical protein